MTLPKSLGAYVPERGVLDQILRAPSGSAFVPFPTPREAILFRKRCYKFRSLAQAQSPTLTSPYDDMVISLSKDPPGLRFSRNVIIPQVIIEDQPNAPTNDSTPQTPLDQSPEPLDLSGLDLAIQDLVPKD